MEVEYINPFIIGAIEIFEKIAQIELKKTSVQVTKSTKPANEICIVFGVAGYLTGQVVYSFKNHTAQRVVSCMMPDSKPEKQAEYFESALSSLANMITGRATILLAGKEHIIQITPPQINIENDKNAAYVEFPTINANFSSRFGTLEINVALRKTQ
ncbi:MAG: chemotaxis protein CheX [Spirochaetes bacterium]|nr:chemotaxis protein CheX [Spirochaetota bacterium]